MAHEQKYRALTVSQNKFVYGYFAEFDGRSLIFNANGKYDVIPETVGQFIGLCDKDGTEIYDGDRVTKFGMTTPECDSTVVYCNGAFGYIADEYIGFVSFAENYHFNWINNKSNKIAVVGNIHKTSGSTKVDGT